MDHLFLVLIIILANKAPKEWSNTWTYSRKGFPENGATRTSGCVRYSLISSNAFWRALSQMNETPSFVNLVKGWQRPERFDMNFRIYASRPCKPLSSLRFLGGCISWTVRIFSGSRWILLDVTTNPRNLPHPGRTWSGSSSTGEPAWCRTLFLGLRGDCLCRDFSRRCHRYSILRSCVYAHERSHSWHVDMSYQHFSNQRALLCSSIFPKVSWKMCAFHLQGTFLFGYTLEAIHEGYSLKTKCVVNHNIHDWEREFVFRASFRSR